MTAHIKDFIEQEFYHFHSHPELSYQEFETTKRLKEDLEKNGIKILPLDLKTGVVAEIGQGNTTVASCSGEHRSFLQIYSFWRNACLRS